MQMIVKLTEEQKKDVEPLLKKAKEDYETGRPGMVVAQILENVMRVGFLPHEKAKLFEKTAKDI